MSSEPAAKASSASAPVSGGPDKASPVDAAAWEKELQGLISSVEKAAEEWGLRPDSREGKFVSALLGTTRWLGRLSLSAQARSEEVARLSRDASTIELVRAREITKASNLSLQQARTAFLGLQVERETTVARMIDETLPMFAERLQGALVIREKLWAEDQRRRRYAMVALVTLGVFLGGYVLRAWQDGGPLDAFGQWCLTHQQQSQGHAFCDVTGFAQSVR